MNKFAKIILIFCSSLLLLLIAAIVIIPLVVDLNDYKPEIEAAVKDKLGRTLSIEGDLEVSVFPWLGISTGSLRLENATEFNDQDFARLAEADIKVKLMPLFSKKIEVKTVVLKGLELYLAKNKQGMQNWDDLVKAKESSDKSSQDKNNAGEKEALPAWLDINSYQLSLSGVKLENSLLSWDNQKANQQTQITNLNLSTGTLAFDTPVELKLSFLLSTATMSDQLSLSTHAIVSDSFKQIQLQNFQLDSVIKGDTIPSGTIEAQLATEIALDLDQQTVTLRQVQLNSNLINLTGELSASQLDTDLQYQGKIQLATFNPKTLMQQLQMDALETMDPQALQKLAMNFDLHGTSDALELKHLNIRLDETQLNGELAVKQFKNPAIRFQLNADKLDLDRYLAPEKPVVTATVKKAADNHAKNIKTRKTDPAASASKAKISVTDEPELLPLELIRSLNVSGNLKIDQLKAAKLKMRGVRLELTVKDGVLQTKHQVKKLYKGSYKGKIRINATQKTPTIRLDEKLKNIQLEPFLKDFKSTHNAKFKGRATIRAKLNAKGNTHALLLSSLGGKLDLDLRNGAIRDFNFQQIIDVGKLLLKGKQMQQDYSNEQTLFSKIRAESTIKRGVVTTPNLLAKSSTVEVTGKGTTNLVTEKVNYHLVAKIKSASSKKGKSLIGRPIAVKVTGDLSDPRYKVDVASVKAMLTEKEKRKVEKFVNKNQKKIEKAIGKEGSKAVNKWLKKLF
ncbi:MAG: AsmA family protein [Methyloprofundus sp.]|nr:AsmA family protein [Methyloprofundus sp.]